MSLFGAPAPASQPSLFGAPQTTSSLFGNQPASTSLFAAPSSAASLFGTAASSAAQFGAPATSSSLFGGSAGSTSLFGAPASSASLFGAATSSASLFGAPASSASLFGGPASSSSLFGAPAASSSLFGAPASSASLFGAPAQGGSIFGAPQQQQQQQQQQAFQHAQQQQARPITGRTRISELPQNFQTDLFAVERHLREQRNKASLLLSKRADVDSDVAQARAQAATISRRIAKLSTELDSLRTNADLLKNAVRTERGSAEPVIVALENLTKESRPGFTDSNGLRYGLTGSSIPKAAHVPEEYFARILHEMETRAHEYKEEIEEIAEFLNSQGITLSSTLGIFGNSGKERSGGTGRTSSIISRPEAGMGATDMDKRAAIRGKTIEEVIKRQYEYFMAVASQIAGIDESLHVTKERFLGILRARDPDSSDPFAQATLREKAAKDRQRMKAERAFSNTQAAVGNTTSSRSGLMQSQGAFGAYGASLGGSGTAVGSGANSNSLLGASRVGGVGFGGGVSHVGDSDAFGGGKRMSSGRRKRS